MVHRMLPHSNPMDIFSPHSLPTGPTLYPDCLMPCRAPVKIDCILLDGTFIPVFEGILDRGIRVMRPVMPETAAGIRLFRFSAGLYKRVIVRTVP